jgi:transposase-like protein
MTIRKLTVIAPFLLSALTAPAFAQEITCEMVRAYVAQVGFEQASAVAREHGITASQERRALACLGKRSTPQSSATLEPAIAADVTQDAVATESLVQHAN